MEFPPALGGALLRLTASSIARGELLANFALVTPRPLLLLVGIVDMGSMAFGIALVPPLLYGGADIAVWATLVPTTLKCILNCLQTPSAGPCTRGRFIGTSRP